MLSDKKAPRVQVDPWCYNYLPIDSIVINYQVTIFCFDVKRPTI